MLAAIWSNENQIWDTQELRHVGAKSCSLPSALLQCWQHSLRPANLRASTTAVANTQHVMPWRRNIMGSVQATGCPCLLQERRGSMRADSVAACAGSCRGSCSPCHCLRCPPCPLTGAEPQLRGEGMLKVAPGQCLRPELPAGRGTLPWWRSASSAADYRCACGWAPAQRYDHQL